MITHQLPAAVVERAASAVYEGLSMILTKPDADRVTQTVIDTLTSAQFTVVLLQQPDNVSAHRATWESRDWQIDSHVGGDIELTTRSGPPDGDRLSLIYDLGAAGIAAAIHNEENR